MTAPVSTATGRHKHTQNPTLPRSMRRSQLLSAQRAFFRLGWLDVVGYPAAFALQQIDQLTALVIQLFVSRIVIETPQVGNDFYTFVVIGMLTHGILQAGLTGFGAQMDRAIQQGRLETLLVEPIPWRLLPFGMVQFNVVTRIATTIVMALLSLTLGARFQWAGVAPAILLVALGFICVMAVGILGAAIKILTKRSDPILTLYSLAAALFSGVWFPLDALPGWLRPLSYALPHTYIVSGARQLLMSDADAISGPSLTVSLLALLAFAAVMYPIAFYIFGRVLDVGRRLGVLAGY